MTLVASVARQGVDPTKIERKVAEKVEEATKKFGCERSDPPVKDVEGTT
jgi:hypothetical protein